MGAGDSKIQTYDVSDYLALGNAKHIRGDYRGAIKDYDKVIRLKPDHVAYYNRGNSKRAKGDHNGAVKDFSEAIRLKQDFAAAYHNRGYSKCYLGDYAGAIEDFDTVINLKPGDKAAQNDRLVACELYKKTCKPNYDSTDYQEKKEPDKATGEASPFANTANCVRFYGSLDSGSVAKRAANAEDRDNVSSTTSSCGSMPF